MPNLSYLSKKIKSIKSTAKITESLKLLSANKFTIYQDFQKKTKIYNRGISNIFSQFYNSIDNSFEEINHILIKDNLGPTLWIVIGSDIGMCGDFNQKLANYFYKESFDRDYVAILGSKLFNIMKNHLKEDNIIYKSLSEINTNIFPEEISRLTKIIFKKFRLNRCSKVKLLYLIDKQKGIVEMINVLPFKNDYFKNNNTIKITLAEYKVKYPDIILKIFPWYFETLIAIALTKSKISEHNTRRDLMHEASKSAKKLLDEYMIKFNKTRQAAITQEILEIVVAMQSKKS